MVATTYSYDFYLRGIYSSNRGARKAERRSSMQNSELTKADSSAMKKIIEQLRQLEWSEPTVMEDKDSNSMNTSAIPPIINLQNYLQILIIIYWKVQATRLPARQNVLSHG